MALSTQVKDSVNNATANLRDALAFAARSEHPIVLNCISDILSKLENLESLEVFVQSLNTNKKDMSVVPPFSL